MKVIIAGGRDFDDYELLRKHCDDFFWNALSDDIEIVSGCQVSTDKDTGQKYGADYLGEQYAKDNGYPIKPFPANWDKYGKSAGPIRNEEMAMYADTAIIFWDGKSRGTKSMVDFAKKHKLILKIIRY